MPLRAVSVTIGPSEVGLAVNRDLELRSGKGVVIGLSVSENHKL